MAIIKYSVVAPNRYWYATGNFTQDGKPMFASKEWEPGEKLAYERSVLSNMKGLCNASLQGSSY